MLLTIPVLPQQNLMHFLSTFASQEKQGEIPGETKNTPKEIRETIGGTWRNVWVDEEKHVGITTTQISEQLSSFQAASYKGIHLRMTDEYALWENQYRAVHLSMFSPQHSILCKIYLNGRWWRVQISHFCLIISWRISRWHLDIRNAIKCLNIWLTYKFKNCM